LEFKLNKIDTDIRKKMQEEIKEDKVHSGKNITIKKDIKEEKQTEIEELKLEEPKKRYITIDGVKYNKANIDVDAEKLEEIKEENSKGRILDITK
jgi:hypothetical protein